MPYAAIAQVTVKPVRLAVKIAYNPVAVCRSATGNVWRVRLECGRSGCRNRRQQALEMRWPALAQRAAPVPILAVTKDATPSTPKPKFRLLELPN
jgi:hypothetical protein